MKLSLVTLALSASSVVSAATGFASAAGSASASVNASASASASASAYGSINAGSVWNKVNALSAELSGAQKIQANTTLDAVVGSLADQTAAVAAKIGVNSAQDIEVAVKGLGDYYHMVALQVAGGAIDAFKIDVNGTALKALALAGDLTAVIKASAGVKIDVGGHMHKRASGLSIASWVLEKVGELVLGIGIASSIAFPLLAPLSLIGTQIAAGVLFIVGGALGLGAAATS